MGMAAISLFSGLPSEKNPYGKCALIYDVSVTSGARGNGYGRKLMRSVLRFCREEQVGFIHLNASEMGKTLYQSLGFTEYHCCPEMRMYHEKLKQIDLEE